MEHRESSIIVRVTDYGEADRLVTFFTQNHGKIRGVAKNAKKSRKRFGGALEPGTVGLVRYVEKPNVELVRLEDIAVERPVLRLATSLTRICFLHISLELADEMLPLGHKSKEAFELLTRWINFLGDDNEPTKYHLHAFYYKWLKASGLAPELKDFKGADEMLEGLILNAVGKRLKAIDMAKRLNV